MFNKFIKKSSKFFAVLLTATLAFTPLSYGATPTSFSNFQTLLSDGTVSDITLNADLTAETTDTTLGEQQADTLTIDGANNTVDGANSAYGIKIKNREIDPEHHTYQQKITEIKDIEFTKFYRNDEDPGSVINSKGGQITIIGSSFTYNKAAGEVPDGRAGVIYHKTQKENQESGEVRYGSLTIQNSLFSNNEANVAAAIHSDGVLTVSDTVFENNKSQFLGTLALTGSHKDKTTLTNVTFSSNSSTNNSGAFPTAGAIYLGGDSNTLIADSTFEKNTSAAEGGAIGSAYLDMGEAADFRKVQLDVTGSTFKENTAQTNGGAIDNYFYGSEAYPTTNNETFEPGYVYVKDTTFEENKARNGGAIYNHGNIDGNSVAQMIIDGTTKFIKNIAGIAATVTGNGGAILNEGNLVINNGVEFSTNSASGKGGAIFNTSSGSEGGVIDFNGDATFVDNYTGSEDNKNDIYNDGTINFNGKADGATVTMTGGIVGSGDTNIGDAYNTNNTVSVKLGSDAKLEQNIIYINQNSSLEGNAANIKAAFGGETPAMYNEGSLVLFTNSADAVSFANNVYDPTRTGTTTVKAGANIDMGNHELQQYGLTVEEDATLTVNANILALGESGSGVATNNGNLIFKSATATTPMSNTNEISGTGKLTIDGKVTNNENISISQNNGIEIAEGGEFTAFANDIKAAVTNNGTYDITGGTISYRITGGTTKGFVDINTAEVKISSAISNSQIRLSTGVVVDKEEFLGDSTTDLTIASNAKIDMVNSSTGTATLNSITVNPTNPDSDTQWTLLIDADLAAQQADNFNVIDTVATNNINAFVDTLNITNDFTGEQVSAELQISNKNIGLLWTAASNIISTSLNDYIVQAVNNDNGSFLIVTLQGLLTLPQAIAQGESSYIVSVAEDIVGSWIIDSEGVHNFLIEDLEITGNNKIIKSSTTATAYLDGINVSTKTLTINNLASFEGFENALKVEKLSDTEVGRLNLSTVTFKNNTGDAVIDNEGIATLSGVTFEENTATVDVNNKGELFITATAGETSFEKGIVGTGTTTVSGATVNFGGDAKFEQDSISIEEGSEVTVNAANVKVTGINDILYNSGSLVLYSTTTDTIDFANPIMDVISAGTTTIKTENNIGANINMGDNDLQQYGLVIEEGSSLTVNANKLNIEDQVVNDGSVTFKSANATFVETMVNKSTITTNGTGSLTIDGVVVNQEGTGISEANIYVLENSSFTASANDLTVSSEDGIVNDGNLVFKSETEEMINENQISGNGKFFISGTLTNAEGVEIEQSSVTVGFGYNQPAMVTNEGIIKSTDVVITEDSVLINEGVIKSTHVVVSEDATLVAKGEIDTYDEGNIQGGKITNNGDFIIFVLNDEGEPDTVPNYNTIDGTGTLVISSTNFNVQDNARIDQGAVIIADTDASLKVGVSSITVNPDGAVQNAGKFTLTGEGTNENKVTYYNNTYGETIFDEGSQIINNANIVQSTITIKGTVTNNGSMEAIQTDPLAGKIVIEEGAVLTTSATYVNANNHIVIADGGTLEFTGGNNINNINTSSAEGDILTGNLIISGTDNTTNSGNIAVSTITVNPDISLTNEDGYYIATKTIEGNELINNGLFILNASKDEDYGLTTLTGVGTSSITVESGKTVEIYNQNELKQTTIETYGDGTLLLTGNKIIANIINYMTGDCLELATRLEGTLDNNPANPDTEGVVDIKDGGSVSGQITNSTGTINILTDFAVETGITSNNTSDITKNIINIGSTTARSVVVSTTAINYQTINVSRGSLTLLDEGASQGTIDTSSVTVTAVSTFTANASRITNTTIQNDGLVQFVGGTVSEHSVNTSTITSSSQEVKGKLTIEGVLDNQEGTEISRQNIEVFEDSELHTSASDIKDSLILNDGNLYFVGGDTVNTSTITVSPDGFGYLTIQADKVNNTAEITQNTIEVTGNSTLENNSNITAVNAVVNYGTVQNSSGTITSNYVENNSDGKIYNEQYGVITSTNINNYGTIVSSGSITVKEDLYSNGSITVSSGTLTAGYIENDMDAGIYNEQYGVITSTNIGNWGTIVSSGSITAKGELNNYAGTITVSSGTVDANYIGNLSNIYNEQYGVITSTKVDNWGRIISSGSITVTETLENKEDALIENKEDATIEAGDLINSGIINSSGAITVSNELNNSGTITSSGTIRTAGADNSGTINNEDGGEIYSDTAIHNTGTINSNADGMFADIQNDGGVYNVAGGTISFNVTGGTLDGIVNIKQSSVTVSSTACIGQNTINLEGTELKLEKESNLRTSDLNIGEGATFNIMNGSVDNVDINSIRAEDGITWNFKFDVNLKLGTTDSLINTHFDESPNSIMNIDTINVLEDTDKATTTRLTIADSFAMTDVTNPIFATTKVKYTVEQDLNVTTATVLGVTSEGYGGFPQAVYDGLGLYFATGDEEGNDYVTAWVDDGHGPHDTLIADMSLNGEDSVLLSTGSLTGVKTGSFTLRINDNELAKGLTIKGFEDAITVNAADGRLEVNNVIFSSNTGTAVITNEGTTVLNGVTFDELNTATYDVLNNGNLLLETSSTTFNSGIVGEGTTTIKGVAIDMGNATLAQGMVEISHVAGSSLTVKVDKLQYEREGSSEATVTDLIINNNELVLIGNEEGDEVATLATEIKGFGNTELQKNMDITKDILQTNINLVGATVSVSTETGAKLKATTISVDENSSLTADASNIDTFATNGGINNEGSITFVGGTNNNTITGDQGKIFIEMNKEVINSTGTQISQQFIEVKEGGKFVMNADDVETATDGDLKGIQNNGELEITGGTNKNIIQPGDAISGKVTISGNVTNAEGTSVEQSSITVNSGASFKANANDLIADEIANAGDLEFTGGTNNNAITGTEGTLIISGDVINNATAEQKAIKIETGAVLSSTASALTTTDGITVAENATLKFNSGLEDDTNGNSISGLGKLEIKDNTSVTMTTDETKVITLQDMSIESGSTLVINANQLQIGNPVGNGGTLEYTGGENNNDIEGDGEWVISGIVTNSTGTKVNQSIIKISSVTGSLTANASDLTASTNIYNDAELTFTGGTNNNDILGYDTKGNVTISGDVKNTEGKTIEQSTITVNSGASFTASANDLKKADNGIKNSGDLILVGSSDMTNENDITGEGNLTIKSNMTSSTTITQTNIDIVGGTFTHNAGNDGEMPKITAANISVSTSSIFVIHSEVVATDKITNDGTVRINVLDPDGGADEVESQNNIIGKGDLIISSTNYKNDGGTISQKTLTIEDKDSSFETDITKFEAYNGITDNGNLIYTGTGISSSTITGTGELTIGTADTNADIVNKEGNEISLSTITVNEGSKFTANASNITTTEGMINDAEVTFTGGVNNSTITMTNDNGILNVENDLTNQAAVTQKEIDIKGGDFENVRTSSITAEKITVADGSKLITDAKDLDISDSITITGEGTELNLKDDSEAEIGAVITGAGKIVKEGEGTVTLSGENGYTGTTKITGGAIRIVTANGISEEKVYMDGGKLITGENSEITLSNEILGTDHNDVNIETEEDGNLILDGEIFGNKDLVKTGAGTLDLQMESNSYVGDTVISSGTLRGTTKNINGTVIGSGAADSTVEFYDAEGEVVLNEISTDKFIGTFNKTGASTMTVTNNFKALNANVLSGTFVINNDSETGSGSTFEVTEDMRVENALLKGYGDITTGNLIIGQGATFAPGNSTTTFKVAGNLKFEEDGEYDVEFGQFNMDEAGHYSDNTTVTEKTEIGENAKITLNNLEGKYYVPETIDLITAGTLADGYEYKEDNVKFVDNDANDLRPGYDTRISTRVYTEGNALKVELQRKKSEYSDSLEFERSHNEQEAATAIDKISSGNGGDITNPLDAMEKMYYYQETYDIDGLKAALNDIAGVIHANSTMLTFTNAKIEHVYDKVKERTKDILPCQKMHDKIWAEYYYNTYQVDKNENSPKFDTSVNGFLVGFDMISAKQWTMGITAGYGTSELKQRDDKTTMNDINLGFYGGFENEKWLLKGMLLGGYEQYSTDRTIGFMDRVANSEHNGYSGALDLEAGYKISLNKKDSQAKHKMYLKPYLGVTGSYINNEGYEEKGADSLNLKVEGYDSFAAQARAGIGINGKVKKFGWYAKAGVRQFLTEDYNEIETSLLDYTDQTQMKIRSAELDKFSYGGGLGVDFELSKAWTVFANGLASFADKSNNYYGNVGLMYKFGCPNNEKKTDEDVEKITAMLNDKMTEEEALKRQLADKEKELANKEKELNDAKNREKELQNRIQKYEANVVSEQQAQKMKQNTVKTFRLGEKPTFVFGTDKLNKSGKESLKQVATELEGYPDAEVLVEGHTDNVGGDEINQKISEQRASSVATSLKKDYGVKNNISVIGKGKTEPIASNDTAAGRAKNRRVEVIITTND